MPRNLDLTEILDEYEELNDEFQNDYEEYVEETEEDNEELPEDKKVKPIDFDTGCTSYYEKEKLDRHKELKNFIDEIGESNCRRNSINLIHENNMDDEAKEIARECHNIDVDSWPCNCIDWEDAGNELMSSYNSIEWEGTTYYYKD